MVDCHDENPFEKRAAMSMAKAMVSGNQRRTDKEIPQRQIDERHTVENAVGKNIPT